MQSAAAASNLTGESEGARFGVGEIGLRRHRAQKRCLQNQKREIEFWDGQVRLEDIDTRDRFIAYIAYSNGDTPLMRHPPSV